ncbi:unnamed protein product [Acanthoscelides obtectus]|uniref:Uncharacterized protein n=1 Tax=Acanthoscelides obtectus TaxID=200917 RepID=A0A9P0K4K2_ACAOB|nr:unnamed protein product [Acanthoscelides obtectus]CAK1632595.1 SCAN domain-containing protein 3 [Acanthoscelides obtectus]
MLSLSDNVLGLRTGDTFPNKCLGEIFFETLRTGSSEDVTMRFDNLVPRQIYEMTESGGGTIIMPPKHVKPRSVGKVVMGCDVKIIDPESQKRPTLDRMFASTSQRNDDGLRASYNISLLIAKSGKPHTIGEKLSLLAVGEVLKTVLRKPASDIIKRIPLSNNTVERRIDEMSSDIESFL